MIVCGHGDVSEFCKEHDMVIAEQYEGELGSYEGVCRVLVTDQDMSESEYYFIKGMLLNLGYELISTRYKDVDGLSEFVAQNRVKNGGRCTFGFCRVEGDIVPNESQIPIVKRIFSLRDSGYTYQRIHDDEFVRYPDGRKISISTLQVIVRNRKKYEKEGML